MGKATHLLSYEVRAERAESAFGRRLDDAMARHKVEHWSDVLESLNRSSLPAAHKAALRGRIQRFVLDGMG